MFGTRPSSGAGLTPQVGTSQQSDSRYRPVRDVAQTSSTKVQLCLDSLTNGQVALKLVDRLRRSLYQVEREISIRQTLPEHPNIIGLRDVQVTNDNIRIVEDFCENGDIGDAILAGHVTTAKARKYFRQLTSAIQHMHANGLVHGDVKADNMLLDKEDNVKLTDFEHALRVRDQAVSHSSTGRCTGSIPYNAPEMFVSHSCQHLLPALDMWAAGIVLYAMLAATFPWQRAAMSDANYRAFASGFPEGADGWEKISDEDRELVLGLLHVDQSKRWTVTQAADWVSSHWPAEEADQAPSQAAEPPPQAPSSLVEPMLTCRQGSARDLTSLDFPASPRPIPARTGLLYQPITMLPSVR